MVVQEDVGLILAVLKLQEGGKTKCHKYYPEESSDEDLTMRGLYPGISVVKKSTNQISKYLIERIFEVTDLTTGKKVETRQLHYVGWPDHGVPTKDSLEEFKLLLDDFIKFIVFEKERKAIVHCSAGIGRTGTTIALMTMIVNVYAQLNNGIQDPAISIFSTVRRMRERRLGMVQTPD